MPLSNNTVIEKFLQGKKGTSGSLRSTGDELWYGWSYYGGGYRWKRLEGFTDQLGRKVIYVDGYAWDWNSYRITNSDALLLLMPKEET
ncbi:hypothetical protein LCGC14_0195590 [marine sediment metagenome]|uniref:Uncharacterized protein n=1 Tax=marine sediment metagenome TaxID=412755 RepID=A0A0F9X4F3_9ZZZZ